MRVLYVASELYPLVKTGGLADVSAALPPALREIGVDVRLFLPGLPALRDGLVDLAPVARLGAAFGAPDVRVLRGTVADSGVPAYLLDAPVLFDRPGNPYTDAQGRDWPDNHRRFALLGWAAARFTDEDWTPDVVHAHDWHAGLAPAWLATRAGDRPASVFTVHNLAYQGLVPAPLYPELGLPARFFSVDGLEYHGQAGFMKAGLYYADRLTTVSPTYAGEIQGDAQGMGLQGLLAARRADLEGILNGVDYAVWNPATDPYLGATFAARDLAPKAVNKQALQQELGLEPVADAPLACVVSRLTYQKGLDLVAAALPGFVAEGGQLALLGAGDAALEQAFRQQAARYPGQVAVRIGYDEALSHRLIGSADMILVPSRSEPCGLTQLYGLRYATLPVVAHVGGLADTVVNRQPDTAQRHTATGFVFDHAAVFDFQDALAHAVAAYRRPSAWRFMQRTAMKQDFSWDRSARRYAELYASLRPTAQRAMPE